LRSELIKTEVVNRFVILNENVFEEAFVESVILEINENHKRSKFEVFNSDFNFIQNIETEDLSSADNYRIQPSSSSKELQLTNKIFESSIPLSGILDFCIGIQIGGHGDSKEFKAKYITNSVMDESSKKVIDGKDFDSYRINWKTKYIKY